MADLLDRRLLFLHDIFQCLYVVGKIIGLAAAGYAGPVPLALCIRGIRMLIKCSLHLKNTLSSDTDKKYLVKFFTRLMIEGKVPVKGGSSRGLEGLAPPHF